MVAFLLRSFVAPFRPKSLRWRSTIYAGRYHNRNAKQASHALTTRQEVRGGRDDRSGSRGSGARHERRTEPDHQPRRDADDDQPPTNSATTHVDLNHKAIASTTPGGHRTAAARAATTDR